MYSFSTCGYYGRSKKGVELGGADLAISRRREGLRGRPNFLFLLTYPSLDDALVLLAVHRKLRGVCVTERVRVRELLHLSERDSHECSLWCWKSPQGGQGDYSVK